MYSWWLITRYLYNNTADVDERVDAPSVLHFCVLMTTNTCHHPHSAQTHYPIQLVLFDDNNHHHTPTAHTFPLPPNSPPITTTTKNVSTLNQNHDWYVLNADIHCYDKSLQQHATTQKSDSPTTNTISFSTHSHMNAHHHRPTRFDLHLTSYEWHQYNNQNDTPTVGSHCGKSTFASTFYNKKTPQGENIPPRYEHKSINMTINNDTPISVSLWDQMRILEEDVPEVLPYLFHSTNIFLLCFAIDARYTFSSITTLWAPLVRGWCAEAPILLVGLRSELREDPNAVQQAIAQGRDLSTLEDGQNLAQKIGALGYMECSAETDVASVVAVVNAAIALALRHPFVHPAPKKMSKCNIM